MKSSKHTDLAAELQRRAAEKFGAERAEELRKDLEQMSGELQTLDAYPLGFDDEP
jgi:prefoldin subunit 5